MTQVDSRAAGASPGAVTAGSSTSDKRRRQATWIGLAFLALLFLLPLRGLMRSQGPPMEEGFMLTFPERVLHGDLPNRDFLHLYGPGSLWALAGAFKVFGTSLVTERAFGLLQLVGVVLGVFAIARHWGRGVATLGAAVTLVVLVPPIGLTALAWVGGMAFGLWGVSLGLDARRRGDDGVGRRLALAGGVLVGLALLFRPDLVLATGAASLVVLWGSGPWLRRRAAMGTVLGLSPYLVHFATAGPWTAFRGMVLDPVVYLRGGRRLPVPPAWDHLDSFLQRAGQLRALHWPLPALRSSSELFIWFFLLFAAVATLVAVGASMVRRHPEVFRGRVLLAAGAFSVGLLPQAVQRADSTHLAWASAIPLGLLAVAVQELVRRAVPRLRLPVAQFAAGLAVVVLLVGLVPHFFGRSYADYTLQTFGRHRQAFLIAHEGRRFYYGRPDVARALRELTADADRFVRPGQRLFVGTRDLRKTPYSDAFLYYLFPKLDPATHFIEMDPGVANRKGSRLARDLASADVAILSSVWDDWDEPNDSRKVGPDEPNRVLRREFCSVRDYRGLYELFQKRRPGRSCLTVRR